jgi:hypothetical protein
MDVRPAAEWTLRTQQAAHGALPQQRSATKQESTVASASVPGSFQLGSLGYAAADFRIT